MFAKLLLGLAGLSLLGAPPLPVDTIAASLRSPGQRQIESRKYRVHATILLLGMPIYTRKDVGSGFSSIERSSAGGSHLTSLQFGAGSDPARAKGLNRLGVFHEVILRQQQQEKAAYFGFMTASSEENLDQAKAALAKGGNQALFKVISGTALPGRSEALVYPVPAPVSMQWPRWQELSLHLRDNLPTGGTPQNTAIDAGTSTFLRAMLECLQSTSRKTSAQVVYNGKLYRLATSKSADGALTRVDGVMERSGDKSPFRMWYRPSENALPVKIEYKARSFLRLVFESE